MTTYTETTHAGGFIAGELPDCLSRKSGSLASGQNLLAGAVLGQITKAIAAAPIPAIVGTGTGLMSGLTFGPDAQTGSYVITLTETSATAAFSVTAPDGTVLPTGNVATAYTSTHLSFTIANGGTMTTGDAYTVVVTAGGTPVLVGTGTGVVSAFSLGKDAKPGTYRVQLLATSATAEFEVISPDGDKLKRGQVATAYASSQINFTLANGGTMTSGDYFNIIVAKGSQKYTVLAPTAVDGSQIAVGILFADTDATSAALPIVVIDNNAAVNDDELVWPTLGTAGKATARAQLALRGIVCR
jgi:hypothetical protein